MAEWFLIVVVTLNSRIAMTNVPMESQASCEIAAKAVAASKLNSGLKDVHTVCVRSK